MNAQCCGNSKNVALREERRFAGDEAIHRLFRDTKFGGGGIGDTFVVGNVGADASALALKIRVHHDLSAAFAVALDDMFEFVAQSLKPN